MITHAINASCSLPVLPLVTSYTNWTVISGVPSSGKTTLLTDLAAARPEFSVMNDVARTVIERGLSWRGEGNEALELSDILRTQSFQNTVFAEKWAAISMRTRSTLTCLITDFQMYWRSRSRRDFQLTYIRPERDYFAIAMFLSWSRCPTSRTKPETGAQSSSC